jgi:uncharacterized phosphosugar-binding protein
MSATAWMDKADETLQRIRATQLDAIKQGAALIADSIAKGGALHYFDSGHATGELLHRAGGLFAIHQIQFNVAVNHTKPPLHPAAGGKGWYQDERAVAFLLDQCHLREGDVLLQCSVTGSSAAVVEVALGMKKRGVKIVAVTSPTYSKAIKSSHPSGQFLYQIADVVIDNCGPAGDAAVDIAGLDAPVCPTSGLAFIYTCWSVLAQVMQNLLDRGIKPHVYKSVNMPGAKEFNEQAQAAYEKTGV